MEFKQSALAIALLAMASASYAETNLFVEAGLHFGGDKMVSVNFVGGGSDSIDAGGLLSGSLGFISDLNESLRLRTSIGIKIDVISAENGDLDFNRFPLEGMLFTSNAEGFNFGAGVTYHIAPEFSASGPVLNGEVSFENALGFVAEVDYQLSERAYLGVKFTAIEYKVENPVITVEPVDGNSVGLVIGTRF